MIQVGDEAPNFTLKGTPEDPVELASFRSSKNVVLLFFPLAWTGVCTKEMCTIRDEHSQYESLNAAVLGISVDSPFALGAWAAEQGFGFPLLSDFNREVSQSYDVLYEDLMGLRGVAKRAAFVIDQDGKVRYAEVCPSPGDLPNFENIQNTLRDLEA